MEKVVLDSVTLAKLAGQNAPIEIWSNYGQLIGVFHPKNEPRTTFLTADAELDAAFARSSQEGRISAAEGRAELLRQRPL